MSTDDYFYANRNNEDGHFLVVQRRSGKPDRLIADHIPTALWAEAMVEWMNSLDELPELNLKCGDQDAYEWYASKQKHAADRQEP